MDATRRYSGKYVLMLLTLVVITVVLLVGAWTMLTPGVPDARERMRGSALPGVSEPGS